MVFGCFRHIGPIEARQGIAIYNLGIPGKLSPIIFGSVCRRSCDCSASHHSSSLGPRSTKVVGILGRIAGRIERDESMRD